MTSLMWFFFKREKQTREKLQNNPWERGEAARTEVWVWWGRMGGDWENKGGEEEKYGRGRPTLGCRISDGGSNPRWERRGITARWAPIHGPSAAKSCTFSHTHKHWREKGGCASTHGANGLLLKTCITARRLQTTHVAPAGRAHPSAAPPAEASFIMWPRMTLNYVLTALAPLAVSGWTATALKGLRLEDDWQVPSPLSRNIQDDLWTHPHYRPSGSAESSSSFFFYYCSHYLTGEHWKR